MYRFSSNIVAAILENGFQFSVMRISPSVVWLWDGIDRTRANLPMILMLQKGREKGVKGVGAAQSRRESNAGGLHNHGDHHYKNQ